MNKHKTNNQQKERIENMKLIHLLQAYEFEELMPVINDMFPGTTKYRKALKEAYDILLQLKPVESKKNIRYKLLHDANGNESFMGAEDANFATTWEVCLGKEVIREKGVDRKSTRLNSSHANISYAVFCLKKK